MSTIPPFGLVVLNKPSGLTSRRALDALERLARPARTGHAGTLDPLAAGVLVACVGPATRLIPCVQQLPKRYRGTFLLGKTSPTEDVDGEIRDLLDPPIPSRDALVRATRPLTGQILQRPPAFSALKVKGRRAYDLARAGQPVELPERPVEVYRMEVQTYDYPEVVLDIECGSGTYVRSLGRDLAVSLGTGAVMSALTRLAIGDFRLEEGVLPDSLTEANWHEHLLPPERAVVALPHVRLSEAEVNEVRNGRVIACDETLDRDECAAFDPQGHLVAILIPRGKGRLGPKRNFPSRGA